MFKYVVFTLSCLITYNNVCMASKEVLEALLDKKLEPILAQISEADNTISELVSSISFLSDRYEELRKDISAIRNNNEILKEENVALKADLQDAHRKLSISDHLPNFLIINKFSSLPSHMKFLKRDYTKFNQQLFVNDISSVD